MHKPEKGYKIGRLSVREAWAKKSLEVVKNWGGPVPILFKHKDRHAIDAAIYEGQSKNEIMKRFGLRQDSLDSYLLRVKLREMSDITSILEELSDMGLEPDQVARNLPANKYYGGMDMVDELLSLRDKAEQLFQKAETSGDTGYAISALREQLRIFQTAAKLVADAQKRGEFNPWTHPDIIAYQEGLLDILKNHPEAMNDVRKFLERRNRRGVT